MRWIFVCLALTCAATSSLAQIAGTADLSGNGKLKAKGCGKDREGLVGTWDFLGDGTWTGTTDGVLVLSGTHASQGASGKIASLTFDLASKTFFDDALESWASALCGIPVTLMQPSSISHFDLKLNKRRTRAKLTLFASGTGSTSEGSSTGRYKAIVRGPWTEAP